MTDVQKARCWDGLKIATSIFIDKNGASDDAIKFAKEILAVMGQIEASILQQGGRP